MFMNVLRHAPVIFIQAVARSIAYCTIQLQLRLRIIFLATLDAKMGRAGASTATLLVSLGALLQNVACENILKAGIFQVTPNNEENALEMQIVSGNGVLVTGKIGLGLPGSVGEWEPCMDPDYECYLWGDFAKVYFKEERDATGTCATVEWTSSFARELEDCYDLREGVHWYGGGETKVQLWPVESIKRNLTAFITGSSEEGYGAVVEKYWLTSNGAAIVLDAEVPLFVSVNTTRPNRICFVAKDRDPYVERKPLTFKYHWCTAADVKEAHLAAISNYIGKPSGIPDEIMLVRPLWSTWAEYKVDVNQSIVLDYARRVISKGFANSSHIEIDDNWETCYGELEFDPEKFPDPKAMVDEIKEMGLRVTLWAHPFVNYECSLFSEGLKKEYFVTDSRPRAGISSWWRGDNIGVIDVSNPEAVDFWVGKLRKLQKEYGIDSFKFDGGDVSYLPSQARPHSDTDNPLWPNLYTTKFVDISSTFGGLIEVRVGHWNQKLPIFNRMLDKDSRWGYDNGLQSMIPSLLLMSIIGYPFVLPDMIGGNAYYNETTSKELYIRWMQTIQICQDVLEQREKYQDVIIAAANQAVQDGSPVNRPMWWVDPKDAVTFTVDDAYMLGDDILVAPVVVEGATSRDLYLPRGSWTSAQDGQVHQGPIWLRNYPAPLNVVPFFIRT